MAGGQGSGAVSGTEEDDSPKAWTMDVRKEKSEKWPQVSTLSKQTEANVIFSNSGMSKKKYYLREVRVILTLDLTFGQSREGVQRSHGGKLGCKCGICMGPRGGWGGHNTAAGVLPEEAEAETHPLTPTAGDQVKDLRDHLETKPTKVKCCRPRAEPRRKQQGPWALAEPDCP